ncbi:MULTISPECIES: mannosyl-3-phosphoglycerate phosphatase-related protein YedP [Prochlorococcus]|uniref:mannosyl-3-phosphoglycerate phosphatase-related protein YedP n=1 Tax=Prochlorococcus TaxID=1218 RepID=UPI00053397E2|nr:MULTISPECIES: mannosyl-3-phosphoglycerate phosphatase-related protein YedP [Prochlorococcus]KGG12659.1 putative mannosyl-3-phosphoglycerate phosphatasee [Prochlorococcus sp. MIT 0601]
MIISKDWWIVTDIDGTLMDHDYNYDPALPTISWLKDIGIPIIPCTSKTATEVRSLREELGLNDPYIVENGGAIYGFEASKRKEWELILGKSFKELRLILDSISQEIGYSLKPLNDLSHAEIKSLTGLKGDAILKALDRKWSVPFLNPPSSDRDKLIEIAKKFDANIYKGNRMSHLLSQASHKGLAVLKLKQYLNKPDVKIIGLGDSHNDIPLLEAADYSIVVPGNKGPNEFLLEGIEKGEYILAPKPHAEGWAISIRNLLNSV